MDFGRIGLGLRNTDDIIMSRTVLIVAPFFSAFGLQGVIRLRDTYGAPRLDAACARALFHASPYYRTVKTILAGGFDQHPLPDPATTVHAPTARFARNAQSLFDPDSPTRH